MAGEAIFSDADYLSALNICCEFIDDNSVAVGYDCWIVDENGSQTTLTKEDLQTAIDTEKILFIRWPNCDISPPPKMAKFMKNKGSSLEGTTWKVKVCGQGSWIEMCEIPRRMEKYNNRTEAVTNSSDYIKPDPKKPLAKSSATTVHT